MGIIETLRRLEKSQDRVPPLKIELPDKINSLIQSLIKEKQPLEVAIDVRATTFYSYRVYKADTFKEQPSLEIDMIVPKEMGLHALKNSEFLEISFRLGGNPYTFKSSFQAIGDESSPTITIDYPKIIYLHSFRTANRYFITLEDPQVFVNVEYHRAKNTNGFGVGLVKEISIDGISFSTNDKMLIPGKKITANIEITGLSPIVAEAVVKNLKYVKNQEFHYTCGICFEGLSMAQKRGISRIIQDIKKNRANLDKNIFNLERINKIALTKAKIKAKLEGREIKEEELEDVKDLLEFEKLDLDESLDL